MENEKTSETESTPFCVDVRGLWKIFGDRSREILESDLRKESRASILEKTGSVVAVRDVSFQVRKGEFFVIMGLSGSGKSTLIRLLMRLIEPTTGEVDFNGENILAYDEQQLNHFRRYTTGMVFQHFGLFPHRTVIDNVAYGLKVRGVGGEERQAKAMVAIETVGLKGWENYLPGALSGGMQQRVGIARALATEPEILFMDEPFSGLDPLIRREMQDELIELQSRLQKTILFVTHDLHEALKLGDRIVILKDGEIVQVGPPEEVVISPANDYVREFVYDASIQRVLTAGRIMEDPDALIYDWQGPKAALHILRTSKEDHAFVVDRKKKLVGLITMERMKKLIENRGVALSEVMDHAPVTTSPETILEDLFPLAAGAEYPIAVVDENNRFLGEIQISSIFENLIQSGGAKEEDREEKEEEAHD